MASYDIRKMQLRLLDILKEIDIVCRTHGLRYYLAGGTLLGAVRHGGFIPWDDDADIMMPRPDYDQLVRHADEWLPAHYRVRSHASDPDYPFYYAKVEDIRTTIVEGPTRPFTGGIFVDVFPVDGIPSDISRCMRSVKSFKRYCKLLHFLHRDPYKHGRGPRSWWPLALRKLYTRREICERISRRMSRIPYDESELVGCYSPNYNTFVDRQNVYGRGKGIMFEGIELMGMDDNDAYLRKQYGDYMQIPPENKRYNHAFLSVDFDRPYR